MVPLGGRYRLDDEISSGTITSVWRAFDEVLNREVIAKMVVSADAEIATNFRRASLEAAALSHSNIARIYDTGEHDGRPWFVMEFLQGGMLTGSGLGLPERAGSPGPAIADLGADICAALGHAHSLGIVHGSVKESNVGFTESGYPKLVDFGTSEAALKAGPPFKAEAGLSPAGDLRDLGALLYRLATGHQPADPARNPRDFKPELPRPLARAIMTALEGGFPSAHEFEAALNAIPQDPTPTPAPFYSTAGAGGLEPGPLGSDLGSNRAGRAAQMPSAGRVLPPEVTQIRSGPPRLVTESRQSFLHTEGRWLVPVILIVVLAAGLVVSLPALREKISEVVGAGGAFPTAAPIKAESGGVYDPVPGDGAENNEDVLLAFDQNVDTAWRTSSYRTESFGNLKDGVGIYADLGRPASIAGLRVVSELGGWAGTIRYSGDAISWSAPGQPQTAKADQTFTTQGTHRYFMLWITRLVKTSVDKDGDDDGKGNGEGKKNPYSVAIIEITAVAR